MEITSLISLRDTKVSGLSCSVSTNVQQSSEFVEVHVNWPRHRIIKKTIIKIIIF